MTWGRRADKAGRQKKESNPEHIRQRPHTIIESNSKPIEDTKNIPEINISLDGDNLACEDQDTEEYINS